MTDGEMAEEYAKGLCKTCTFDTCRYNTLHTCAIKESLKQAFHAGLEAGKDMAEADLATIAYMQGAERYRPKWHKVADGDLPKEQGVYLVYRKKGYQLLAFDGAYWVTGIQDDLYNTIIAWCEIPKFEETE